MTWLQPWAWLGAATILLPILIHLLGRGQSITHRFPSLRFIDPARLLPAQRTRLQDLPLLAVRIAVVLAAVAALARPQWQSAGGRPSTGGGLARALVVDTSFSMGRLATTGVPGRTAAQEIADRLANESAVNRRFPTASPRVTLSGAVSWLADQPGRREVVLISDFQRGTIDSSALAHLPPSVGVHLVPIELVASKALSRTLVQQGRVVTAAITVDSAATTIQWRAADAATIPRGLQWITGPEDAKDVAAAEAAAQAIGLPMVEAMRDTVALVFPSAPDAAALRARARPLRAAWMLSLVARLRATPLLAQLAGDAPGRSDTLTAAVWSSGGVVRVWAGAEGARLLLFVDAPVASPLAAAVAATVLRSVDGGAPPEELDPLTIAPSRVAAWQRAPTEAPLPEEPPRDSNNGRWLWVAALLLLGVEGWFRSRKSMAPEVTRVG